MRFDVAGPYVISRFGNKKLIDGQSERDLILALEDDAPGLSSACGCYVFALKAGPGYTPYYVGQSCRRSIVKEAFNYSNREKYNKATNSSNGTPVLFLIPMLTPGGKYRKPKKAEGDLPSVRFTERWLISKALSKNPELINTKETRLLRNIHIKGVFNPERGEATTASRSLIKAIT